MSHENQQNRVVKMPKPLDGDMIMSTSHTLTTAEPISESISELEYAIRIGIGIRSMLIYRKAGKLPPHFYIALKKGSRPQVRYLLTDIEAHELKQKTESQA